MFSFIVNPYFCPYRHGIRCADEFVKAKWICLRWMRSTYVGMRLTSVAVTLENIHRTSRFFESTIAMAEPAKILFLHGKQQDAEIFSQRVAWLVKKLQRSSTIEMVDRPIKCVFIDAPHTLPLGEGDSVPMRTWAVYQGSNELPNYDWTPAITAIDSAWTERGPFVGLVAFSQGTVDIHPTK